MKKALIISIFFCLFFQGMISSTRAMSARPAPIAIEDVRQLPEKYKGRIISIEGIYFPLEEDLAVLTDSNDAILMKGKVKDFQPLPGKKVKVEVMVELKPSGTPYFILKSGKVMETEIIVEGIIRLVGTAEFPYLILETTEGKTYLLEGKLVNELKKRVYTRIKVTGTLTPGKQFYRHGIDVKKYEIITVR